jgi:hypothetical protein
LLKIIKPNDLLRTRSGDTAICIELRTRGFRLIENVATGDRSIAHVDDLYLVRSAPVRRWPDYEVA